MAADPKQEILRQVPPMTELLKRAEAMGWTKTHSATLVTESLRQAAARARLELLENSSPARNNAMDQLVLEYAKMILDRSSRPRIHRAINATGIILHTGLGRAVFPECVVDSILPELKGCCTLAVDPTTGERAERDELLEPILRELSSADAATVVNNNAAATLLVLAALTAGKEVIVSRGQLIEIGGSFRLPEVMAQSQARLVEVGATNRTHLKDYERAIGTETAAIMRVHPSNYRIVGFTCQPELAELAALARARGLLLIDDLGAGALVDLRLFSLPHEPTVRESVAAGADIVLCSGDKLIGGSQAGIIFGRQPLIAKIRKHPLMRAMRIDKTCAMILERTLHLFRDVERLKQAHPTYRMISTPVRELQKRGEALAKMLSSPGTHPANSAPVRPAATIGESHAYLGSGTLPDEALPSVVVSVSIPGLAADDLAQRLRVDPSAVFGRIERDRLLLDMRTVTDAELPEIAAALFRVCDGAK